MRFLWWLIGISFVFTAAGMVSLMRGGARHENERILDPTVFEKPEQIGAALFRRNYPLYREARVIILASSALIRDYDRVWQGFINMATERGLAPASITSESGLRELSAKLANSSAKNAPNQQEVFQIVASDEALRRWRVKEPRALIFVQRLFDDQRAKKVDRKKLTASAEVDEQKIVNIFLNDP